VQATPGSGICCVYNTDETLDITAIPTPRELDRTLPSRGFRFAEYSSVRVLDSFRLLYRTSSNFRGTGTSERRYLHRCCSTSASLNTSLQKATNPCHKRFLARHVFAFSALEL